MAELKNARPRFGLEGSLLYDYVAKEYVVIGVPIQDTNGVWDTEKVAQLIEAGQPIEAAFTLGATLPVEEVPPVDKVEEANADFANTSDALAAGDPPADPPTDPAPEAPVPESTEETTVTTESPPSE